jgi:hypothetical protein
VSQKSVKRLRVEPEISSPIVIQLTDKSIVNEAPSFKELISSALTDTITVPVEELSPESEDIPIDVNAKQ